MLQAKSTLEIAHSNESIKTGGEEKKWSSSNLLGKVRVQTGQSIGRMISASPLSYLDPEDRHISNSIERGGHSIPSSSSRNRCYTM